MQGGYYYQVPSRVRSNNRKDEFISGHHDNDTINYLVLNKGGAGLTVDFVINGDNNTNSIGGIELKFSSFFLKDDLQMWGTKPMLRSFVGCLKKRTNKESMDSMLSCFLKEIIGDSTQTVQLCAAMEYIAKKEPVAVPVSLSHLDELLCVDTSNNSAAITIPILLLHQP